MISSPPLRFFALLILSLSLWGCTHEGDGRRLTLEGRLIQGGLMIGMAAPDAEVWLNEKHIRVYDDGRFLLGFGRDAVASQHLRVRWPSGRIEETRLTIEAQTYEVQRINRVDQTRVTPPQEMLDRIARENAQTRAARDAETSTAFFDAGWIWPVSGPITGVYGSARIYNGTPGNPHWGLDIAAPKGRPVLAPSAGVVRLVHEDNYFAGGLVILDHGYGLSSSFLHLSRIFVRPGDLVGQGTILGEVGSTGRSTGPHLDWRMNLGSDTRLDVALLPLPDGP